MLCYPDRISFELPGSKETKIFDSAGFELCWIDGIGQAAVLVPERSVMIISPIGVHTVGGFSTSDV